MDNRSGSPQRSTSDPMKIGFFCCTKRPKDCEILIFAPDSDSGAGGNDYPEVAPAVRITGFGSARYSPGMCVSNSTLYIFEGRPMISKMVTSVMGKGKGGRSVWKLDLSSELLGRSNCPMTLADLTKLPDMLSPKSYPRPIPIQTAKGLKIVVLSNLIDQVEGCPIGDMELYDPYAGHHEKLPKLPCFPPFGRSVPMLLCSLLGDSRFIIHTDEDVYIMNLDKADREWERVFDENRVALRCFVDVHNCYITMKNRYVLAPELLCDLSSEETDCPFTYPLSRLDESVQGKYSRDPLPAIILVDEEDEVRSVYRTLVSQVQSIVPIGGATFRVLIDLCCSDLDQLRTDVLRSLRFSFIADPVLSTHAIESTLFQVR